MAHLRDDLGLARRLAEMRMELARVREGVGNLEAAGESAGGFGGPGG
jgi:hypothetical protein